MYLCGEIDYTASLELEPKLRDITRNCTTELLFDLSQVTLIDSEGIKLLLNARDRMIRRSGRFGIIKCSNIAQRVLTIAGVGFLLISENEVPVQL